jgi:hypothetical protein
MSGPGAPLWQSPCEIVHEPRASSTGTLTFLAWPADQKGEESGTFPPFSVQHGYGTDPKYLTRAEFMSEFLQIVRFLYIVFYTR